MYQGAELTERELVKMAELTQEERAKLPPKEIYTDKLTVHLKWYHQSLSRSGEKQGSPPIGI